jgi:hypothetical protein
MKELVSKCNLHGSLLISIRVLVGRETIEIAVDADIAGIVVPGFGSGRLRLGIAVIGHILGVNVVSIVSSSSPVRRRVEIAQVGYLSSPDTIGIIAQPFDIVGYVVPVVIKTGNGV